MKPAKRQAAPAKARAPGAASPAKAPTLGSFPIVGIGASAGGLEAFRRLLTALPSDTGMAFVLVQHLDPNHESILAELLSEATQMEVREVKGDAPVEPNQVYVIPPSKGLILVERTLRLTPRLPGGTSHLPIDSFFRSLATSQGSQAIGVILSGMGSDGTLGLKAIEAEGGIALVQEPSSAKSEDMPRNAINAGSADFVLSPEEIAHELTRLGRHPYLAWRSSAQPSTVRADVAPVAEQDEDPVALAKILELLWQSGGTDFRAYKKASLRRRIGRRMAIRRSDTLADYAEALAGDAAEAKALYVDCLISVTSFFRDPGVFEALSTQVFARLLDNRSPDMPLRVWVPGCATGQEAYSIAICLVEHLARAAQGLQVQIFATDLSEAALDTARAGKYPLDIAREISPARLQRFFTREGDYYCVKKPIRDICAFARHDLIRDPPYSRIDLVSCRNLLIYLEAPLQEVVFATFHYALRPDGFLLVGPAETVGASAALFSTVDEQHRIYSRKALSGPPRWLSIRPAPAPPPERASQPPALKASAASEAPRETDRMLLARFGPAGVLVDEGLRVLEFRGETAPFIDHSQGKASLHLERILRKGLLMGLRQAIAEARRTDAAVRRRGLRVRYRQALASVAVEVVPIKGRATPERCLFILFEVEADVAVPARRGAARHARKGDAHEPEVARLNQALSQTTDYMHTLVREHESALEELQSTTEEALSSNEELQSLNEELQTAKEEVQSANEELATLNQELQDRNTLLGRMNVNIQHGLDTANSLVDTLPRPLLILDAGLRVEKANIAFYECFHVTLDLTRQHLLSELGNGQWNDPKLLIALRAVLENGTPIEDLEITAEFPSIGARTMLVSARRLTPELGVRGQIVMGIEDRTEVKRASFEREALLALADHARRRAEAADHLKDQFVATASHELRGPQSVIASWMNILINAGPEPDPATLAKALAAIGRGVSAQDRLISDLFDHSQLASGKVELDRRPVDLLVAAESALVGVRAAAEAKEIDIQLAGDLATSVVLGDADRLQQVLWNLFLNAVKFTQVGGSIRIGVARVGNQVHLTVSDNGCGIPADFLPHVFERFRQAEGSSNRAQPGLGLGLTLVRELVELHGGTVHAESPGRDQGATFTIVLPIPAILLAAPPPLPMPSSHPPPLDATPPSVRPPPGRMPASDALEGTSVLVVDDEEDARDALVHLLERYGANVRPAASVAEAMSILAKDLPDVLISDLGMPGADGYELIRRVRLLPPNAGGRLPSMAVSAYATDQHRKKVLKSGFQKYLEKPVPPVELVTEVARLAGRPDFSAS